MGRHKTPRTFIYAALPCEAKPLAEYFKLKKDTSIQPFAVYSNQDICLTVTGVGKNAMAAGVAYTQALFGPLDHPVLVNIGIAGHKSLEVGSLFLVGKITDSDSGKSYYPPLVFTPPCPSACVKTAAKPQLAYDQQDLCDMEASAFYETAMRFSSGELIQCLKVISDNEMSPAENIKPNQVSQLIAGHVETIGTLLEKLTYLSNLITVAEPQLYGDLIRRYRFTVSEQGQLRHQLSRWGSLMGQRTLEFDGRQFHKGKDVLCWLEQQIDGIEFSL